ncbi:hypothetical protein GYMLUDRAFT_49859, partial [Collybiopsis luxurians FD-317 M1]
SQAFRFDVDLLDLLVSAEEERLEEGYESEDSQDGNEEEGEEDEDDKPAPLDSEFQERLTQLERDIYEGQLTESECEDDTHADMQANSTKRPSFEPQNESTVCSYPSVLDPSNPNPASSPPIVSLDTARTQNRKRKRLNASQKAKKTQYHKEVRRSKRMKVSDVKYDKEIANKRAQEAHVIPLDVDAKLLPVSSTGFQGRRTPSLYKGLSREQVIEGKQYFNWDKTYDAIFCDRVGRGMIHCLSDPRDVEWQEEVHPEVCRVLEKARINGVYGKKKRKHRRGGHVAEAIGYSHGGGQKEPSNTKHSKRNQAIFETLLANKAIQRVSGLANSGFKRFCPAMYEAYRENDEALRAWKPSLRKNFPDSVFAATTFNLGPQTVTPDHVDHGNYPGGCAITSAGSFDDTKGGELVVWDLNLVIRFPPGSTIIILSALLRHSNLPIQPGEKRYSITQYSAGALFRFASNGLKNDKEFLWNATPEQKQGYLRERRTHWDNVLDKFKIYN